MLFQSVDSDARKGVNEEYRYVVIFKLGGGGGVVCIRCITPLQLRFKTSNINTINFHHSF